MHAAEASLSQLFNLAIAYLLLKLLRFGRSSAVGGMRSKLASFVLVTAGLWLCTYEDTAAAGFPVALYPNGSAPPPGASGLWTNASSSEEFYRFYNSFPHVRTHGHFWRHSGRHERRQRQAQGKGAPHHRGRRRPQGGQGADEGSVDVAAAPAAAPPSAHRSLNDRPESRVSNGTSPAAG